MIAPRLAASGLQEIILQYFETRHRPVHIDPREAPMDRGQIIATSREHQSVLRGRGVLRAALFGSVARGEASSESDVDLMAEFDAGRQFSLLDMVHLENRLTDILGVRVDLASARAIKDRVREQATREAVLAF